MFVSSSKIGKMKIAFFIVSVILISITSYSQSLSEENLRLKEEIKKLDLAHARAIFEGDIKTLDILMDDDITVNHPTNKIVKEKLELVRMIKEGTIKYSLFDREPETFLFYDNMVVVMGNELVIPAEGAPNAGKKLHRRYTNIWMKKKDEWKLAVRHANNICD